jgi:integrase
MVRALNRLSARTVATLRLPGRHADGGGLYATLSSNGARRRWVFLFRWEGKLREMGLGGLDAVPLARARELAAICRLELAEGRNPLDAKRAQQDVARRELEAQRVALAREKTFGEVADDLMLSKSPAWRNEKHRAQWAMTLQVYAAPLRGKPAAQVTTEDILGVLQPIWNSKPETASRLRGRIEAVLDAARARGLIPAHEANPARWRGHLDQLLAKRPKLSRGHHAALDWKRLPAFMRDLEQRPDKSARALEFCILTAARLGEALGARWREICFEAEVWICPAPRMKAGREHRVPLSLRTIKLLKSLPPGKPDDFLFPGAKRGKPLSNMVMAALFKRMKENSITSHGFRSTFRDWAGEATQHPREICEAALAHSVGNAVEQAYRRGDALEKRRALMNDWAAYIDTAPTEASAGVREPKLAEAS